MFVAVDCELPALPTSIREARRATRAALAGVCDTAALEALALVVSELATNAVEHARSGFRLRALVTDDGGQSTVRIEVTDADVRPPRKLATHGASLGGRGMHLVEQLSTAWGVEPVTGGKRVYAELPC